MPAESPGILAVALKKSGGGLGAGWSGVASGGKPRRARVLSGWAPVGGASGVAGSAEDGEVAGWVSAFGCWLEVVGGEVGSVVGRGVPAWAVVAEFGGVGGDGLAAAGPVGL